MRIMSVNAWGGTLAEHLLPYLAAEQPDVLAIQEVGHSPQTDKPVLTYRDGDHVLAQRTNLFADLCRALPDHVGLFCPSSQGELWDGDIAVPSQYGVATFVHRDLVIVGQAQNFIHGAYSPDGYGAHPRPRGAHAVRLYDPAAKRFVSVTNIHGLRDLAGKMDTPERMDQAHRILALSRQASEPGDIAVICGDFNVEPDSATLALLEDAGFAELVTSRNFTSTRTSLYTKPGRFADYTFINRPQAVRGFDVIYEPEVSDHCPMVLEI